MQTPVSHVLSSQHHYVGVCSVDMIEKNIYTLY